jgi:hypothetical protein
VQQQILISPRENSIEITIHRVLADGTLVLTNQSRARRQAIEHTVIRSHCTPKDTLRISLPTFGDLGDASHTQLLVFWTSCAFFHVDRSCKYENENNGIFSIFKRAELEPWSQKPWSQRNHNGFVKPNLNEVSTILLNKSWRAKQPDKLEFILIHGGSLNGGGGAFRGDLEVMLIEWVNGIAYRVNRPYQGQRPNFHSSEWQQINQNDWMYQRPQQKLIVLG